MGRLYKILPVVLALHLSACTDNEKNKPTDTLTTGNIEISVDETYKPIIEEHLKVFDSSFPDGHITAHYKPESECIKDFMDGKARLILVTRDLSKNEREVLEANKVVATALPVAKDAVAVILNKDVVDTMLDVSAIRGILTGVYSKKYTVVFDHQGSSTVRYMMDSLIPGEKLGSGVFAAKSNEEVIAYVAKNPDAIGFIGVSYVSDFSDPEGLAFINNVKIASIWHDSLREAFKPYQAYIAQGSYPMTRSLYYINRETYPGLGTGFANFLSKERGQLIFKQARLFPLRSNIVLREAEVNR
ncbi:PstS family phosphate ABC transporter substrate-binding protein [Polluticoccus soli]|uniref:PstS family phosphate ABC transporter substrate-binding protein n=1 Tax=Polluticoccus soli TaxID=3034150 RepID=UPI0023E335F8|nr:substrate-binding domain-containing protein [Flavipsychrobacter sp. JY13-12]